MALRKTFVEKNGISTSYHKVSNVTVCCDEEISLHVGLTSYLDEIYREKEQSIQTHFYIFELTNEEEASTSARKLAYAKVKTLDEWADAIDC